MGRARHRIHQEDFAQILGIHPGAKYDAHDYETIGRLVVALAPHDDVVEYIRRLVFVVLSGNGDAHHENWSLVYGDGVSPRLSPAYDLVCTLPYVPRDRLALNLAKSKQFEDVGLDSFSRLGRKIGLSDVDEIARQAVIDVLAAWEAVRDTVNASAPMQLLIEHLDRVPLVRQCIVR